MGRSVIGSSWDRLWLVYQVVVSRTNRLSRLIDGIVILTMTAYRMTSLHVIIKPAAEYRSILPKH